MSGGEASDPQKKVPGDTAPGVPENALYLALAHPLASFLAALRFLTMVPFPWGGAHDDRFFKGSLLYFPVIGFLIGGMVLLVVSLVLDFLPSSLSALLGMALLAGFSGGLHLDGLADSCDGLLSYRPRERALEIMRDSHIGAMGVLALVFVLLGKYAALATLSRESLLQALVFMPLAGRTAIVLSMAILPYARPGVGLGRLFYSKESRLIAGLGVLSCLALALLGPFASPWIIAAALGATVLPFSLWCYLKLGGATGDTLGAVSELTELAVAVGFCIASRIS